LDQFQNNIPLTDQDTLDSNEPIAGHHASISQEEKSDPGVSYNETGVRSQYSSAVNLPDSSTVYRADACEDFTHVKPYESIFRRLVWPATVICVPMLLLSVALLYVVFHHLIEPVENVFDPNSGLENFNDHRYLLVNFSATKLVFVASFLSTMAPLLAGCILQLTGVLVYRELIKTSHVRHFAILPTPYQMSLLVGVLSASYEQLYNAFVHLLSRKRRARVSPVLLYAVWIFLLSALLGLAVALTDAYLHIATQTVSMTLYSKTTTPTAELGRGVNSYCLGVDRVKDNYGFPCTYAKDSVLAANKNFQNGQPELQRIAHNFSTLTQMRLADVSGIDGGRIAFLMPSELDLPESSNYKAKTIGVATKCGLIPPKTCNITRWGDKNVYTSFNCSSQFWGVLGMQPFISVLGGTRPYSPYLSFLAVNQNSNLIYNYFADPEMETVYNTAGLNASALPDPTSKPWDDNELNNTIYAAFAWRTGTSYFSGWGSNGMVQSNLVQRYNDSSWVDYFVNCAVSAYDVEYIWANGSLQSIDAVKYNNGSILNMWTGTIPYMPGIAGGDYRLQDSEYQSVIAGNTTTSYEQKYGELLSQYALSTIGAYTSGRSAIQQQDQRSVLIAKVPKLALGSLLACSLIYPILGIILFGFACKASRLTGPMAPLFSCWGLAWTAFLENSPEHGHDQNGPEAVKEDNEDDFRLFIQQQGSIGHKFGLWKRARTGEVMEMARSQTNVASWM